MDMKTDNSPEAHLLLQPRLLVIGDVHGEMASLSSWLEVADEEDRHVVFLGDLVDRGPHSAGVLQLSLPLVLGGRASWVRGNHDDKLMRALAGNPVRIDEDLATTIRQIREAPDPDLSFKLEKAWELSRLWLAWHEYVFVHGAFDPDMLTLSSDSAPRRGRLASLALYGETTGKFDENGFPERTYGWVDKVPNGTKAFVGHDVRSREAPLHVQGTSGGHVVFLDTGAGKGGPLSAIRLP